jgi:riboflavin biosynthesis pyrimidine reductase
VTARPQIGAVAGIEELESCYCDPPDGVRANMIFSADGAAAFGGQAGPLSCPTDQQLLGTLRSLADVVLVGAGTARAENYGPVRLTERQRAQRANEGRATPPIAVVSRTGALPDRLFEDAEQKPILVTSARAAKQHNLSEDKRWTLLVAGDDTVDMSDVVTQLQAQGMPRILCEGGPTLLDELVDADAVAEICVTLAPKLASSQPVGSRAQASSLRVPIGMRLGHALVHEDFLFLRYQR